MLIRRAVYYWQFAAALLLPLWLFVGWGIWGGSAWTFLGVVAAAPILFVAMLVVTLLVYGRHDVRRSNAVSWLDAGLLLAWHASIVGFGCFGSTASLFAVLTVVLGVAVFWASVWQLVRSFTNRARAALRDLEQMATPPSAADRSTRRPVDGGEVFVVYENTDRRRA